MKDSSSNVMYNENLYVHPKENYRHVSEPRKLMKL